MKYFSSYVHEYFENVRQDKIWIWRDNIWSKRWCYTLFAYKVLHSDSDLKLDFDIEIKPTVRRFKICIWRDKPAVLDSQMLIC